MINPILLHVMKASKVLYQMMVNHPLFGTIDVNRASNHYVVIDPADRNHILYLTERQYFALLKVCLSNDAELTVLAQPSDNVQAGKDGKGPSPGPSPSVIILPAPGVIPEPGKSEQHKLSPILPQEPKVPESQSSEELPLKPHPLANSISREEWDSLSESQKRDVERTYKISRKSPSFKSIWTMGRNRFAKWMFAIGANGENRLLGLTGRNICSLIVHWGVILSVRLGYKLSDFSIRISMFQIGGHLSHVWRSRGINDGILRMKASVYAIYSFVGGRPLADTRHLGTAVGLSHGLPSFLPSSVRNSIRSGNLKVIRLITSLLTSYRALQGVWKKPTLSTISNTPFTKDISFLDGALRPFWEWVAFESRSEIAAGENFKDYISKKSLPNIRFPDLNTTESPFTVKTGANFWLAPLSAALDLVAWSVSPRDRLTSFMQVAGQFHLMAVLARTLNRLSSFTTSQIMQGYNMPSNRLRLGKLALKYEAAGKVRVFAIVDFWTQMAMYPLHNWIFDLLKKLPTDGTFDQEKAVRTFAVENSKEKIYSYDLSAATDNIPVVVTTKILSYALGPKVATAWEKLMVDRHFLVPKGPNGADPSLPEWLRYGRGQPIGALSSWASLALTHHFVVQLAAMRANRFPFMGYRVLGDDIVIAGTEVADLYVSVCSELEIPLNNKGITSDPDKAIGGLALTNFANQYFLGTENISPISLKEEVMIHSLAQRVQNVVKLVQRGVLSINRSLLEGLIRVSAIRVSYTRQMLDMVTLGITPTGVRGLLAILLFTPSGEIAFQAKLPKAFKAIPFLSSWVALTGDAKELQGNLASNDLESIVGSQLPLVRGSAAYEYWALLQRSMLRRADRIMNQFKWVSTPFMGINHHRLVHENRLCTPYEENVVDSLNHKLTPRDQFLAYLNADVLTWMLVGSARHDFSESVEKATQAIRMMARVHIIWSDGTEQDCTLDQYSALKDSKFTFTGGAPTLAELLSGAQPEMVKVTVVTATLPSPASIGAAYMEAASLLDSVEASREAQACIGYLSDPLGVFGYVSFLIEVATTTRSASSGGVLPPFKLLDKMVEQFSTEEETSNKETPNRATPSPVQDLPGTINTEGRVVLQGELLLRIAPNRPDKGPMPIYTIRSTQPAPPSEDQSWGQPDDEWYEDDPSPPVQAAPDPGFLSNAWRKDPDGIIRPAITAEEVPTPSPSSAKGSKSGTAALAEELGITTSSPVVNCIFGCNPISYDKCPLLKCRIPKGSASPSVNASRPSEPDADSEPELPKVTLQSPVINCLLHSPFLGMKGCSLEQQKVCPKLRCRYPRGTVA